jgi:hypothetical protein
MPRHDVPKIRGSRAAAWSHIAVHAGSKGRPDRRICKTIRTMNGRGGHCLRVVRPARPIGGKRHARLDSEPVPPVRDEDGARDRARPHGMLEVGLQTCQRGRVQRGTYGTTRIRPLTWVNERQVLVGVRMTDARPRTPTCRETVGPIRALGASAAPPGREDRARRPPVPHRRRASAAHPRASAAPPPASGGLSGSGHERYQLRGVCAVLRDTAPPTLHELSSSARTTARPASRGWLARCDWNLASRPVRGGEEPMKQLDVEPPGVG